MSSIKEINRSFGAEEVERWAMDWHRDRPPIDRGGEVRPVAVVSVGALPVTNGVILRVAFESGRTADLFLTAAAAMMLGQTIAAAGQLGGWLDEEGDIVTFEPHLPAPPGPRKS